MPGGVQDYIEGRVPPINLRMHHHEGVHQWSTNFPDPIEIGLIQPTGGGTRTHTP